MIYLDNSATTKQFSQVTKLMTECMEKDFGNPSSLYQLGVDSEKIIKQSRRQITDAIGIADSSVYFTSGGTEADNMAIFGAVKSLRRRGKKIITSTVEHPAVLRCFQALETQGYQVEYINVDDKCRLDMEQMRAAIDENTILVSLMHVNNEIGTVMPVKEVKDIIRERKASCVLHCDCVQSFGKLTTPDAADIVCISGHKLHGPKGVGGISIKRGINIPAFIEGGGQESGKRSGTQNVPAIAGFGLAAQICRENMANEMKRIASIRETLIKGFSDSIEDIVINSPMEVGEKAGECCAALLSVSFPGTKGEVLLHTLEQDEIYVSTGSACSSNKKGQSHVLTAMGKSQDEIDGTIRFSIGRLNSMDETEKVVCKVAEAVKKFRLIGRFR